MTDSASLTRIDPRPGGDALGREMRDLRISVTDRCNFRCVYCMPKEVFGPDHAFLPRAELLTFEEIIRIARVFVDLGIKKIRLTGGEPLLRKNLEKLIEQLAVLPVELTLTTNGSLLTQKASSLRNAGLHRITVSLDSLDDAVFKQMNDVEYPVSQVLSGIDAAARVGFPVKVNCVVKRGTNEHQILPLVAHFKGSGHILRFIEYMDVGSSNGWRMDEVLPSKELVELVSARYPLQAIKPDYQGEVAQRWRFADGSGEIGVISSVTQAFCSTCTRVRLSTEGKLYTCLFAQDGHDLRSLVRQGHNDDEANQQLHKFVQEIWSRRADRYSEIRTAASNQRVTSKKIEMSYIGG